MPAHFETGLDRILTEPLPELTGRRFGLLFNQASLSSSGIYAADALAERYSPENLVCLFSPQHGLWGEEQANMIETDHSCYRPLDVQLYSLYSRSRQPSPDMLADLEMLVIDLQDVGTRVYTFIWTMLKCLEACVSARVPVLVLDRPNPLGGVSAEGQLLREEYQSFVGLASIPMRHGLTIGELAKWFVCKYNLDVDLQVVPMSGWRRVDRFPACGRHWICPSPNMPSYRTTVVYPGGVLLEGTNLSEGRGTTIPFEVVGSPFIDELALARRLNACGLPGVRFRPTRFRPTFDKWQGQSCCGVYLDVTDQDRFQSYRTTLHILHAVRQLHGDQLQWLPPPYEYEAIKLPIDILTGGDEVRVAIDSGCETAQLDALSTTAANWWQDVHSSFLYE